MTSTHAFDSGKVVASQSRRVCNSGDLWKLLSLKYC